MTNEELDRLDRKMAEVMGWRGYGDWWETQDLKDQIMKMSDWQPTRRIEQAMMVVFQLLSTDKVLYLRSWCNPGIDTNWPCARARIESRLHPSGSRREAFVYGSEMEWTDPLQVNALAICRAVEAAWEKGGDANETDSD